VEELNVAWKWRKSHSRGGGRRWWRQESDLQIFWKKDHESLSRLSL